MLDGRTMFDDHAVRLHETRLAGQHDNPSTIQQVPHTSGEPFHDVSQMGLHRRHIEVCRRRNPPGSHPVGCHHGVGHLDQCLGRDAADVEAGATQFATFHKGHPSTQAGCVQGGGVATWATANYEHVDRLGDLADHHGVPLSPLPAGSMAPGGRP